MNTPTDSATHPLITAPDDHLFIADVTNPARCHECGLPFNCHEKESGAQLEDFQTQDGFEN